MNRLSPLSALRNFLIMAAFFSVIARLFGGEPSKSPYKTATVYDDLRKQALHFNVAQVETGKDQTILAVLMETGYAEAVATLLAVADGSASLYFSNGGGIIGAGEKPEPNAAARKLVAKAAEFESALSVAKDFPLPQREHTRFYIVTKTGVLTAEAMENDLGGGRHVLSPLFHAAHKLITEIRLTEQRRKQE